MLDVNYIPPNKVRYLMKKTVGFLFFGSILCFFVFWSLHPLIDGKESCKDIDVILVENNMNLYINKLYIFLIVPQSKWFYMRLTSVDKCS